MSSEEIWLDRCFLKTCVCEGSNRATETA